MPGSAQRKENRGDFFLSFVLLCLHVPPHSLPPLEVKAAAGVATARRRAAFCGLRDRGLLTSEKTHNTWTMTVQMTLPSCLFSFIIVGSTVLPPSSPDVSVSVSSASARRRGHASSRLRRFTSRRVRVYIIACDSGIHRSSGGHAYEGDERERRLSGQSLLPVKRTGVRGGGPTQARESQVTHQRHLFA